MIAYWTFIVFIITLFGGFIVVGKIGDYRRHRRWVRARGRT